MLYCLMENEHHDYVIALKLTKTAVNLIQFLSWNYIYLKTAALT